MTFTQNWSGHRVYWPELFDDLGLSGKADLHFLEIGCYEGETTTWLLENILTHPTSKITVCDTFTGSPEFASLGIEDSFSDRWRENTEPYRHQITEVVGRSQDTLLQLAGPFDFAYIDGSHVASDVLTDAVLVWRLVRQGGVMVFDDYRWLEEPGPRRGAFAFLDVFRDQYRVRLDDYQLGVEKMVA